MNAILVRSIPTSMQFKGSFQNIFFIVDIFKKNARQLDLDDQRNKELSNKHN